MGNAKTTTTTETHTYNTYILNNVYTYVHTYVHTVPMQAYKHSGLTLTFGIGVHNSTYIRMYVHTYVRTSTKNVYSGHTHLTPTHTNMKGEHHKYVHAHIKLHTYGHFGILLYSTYVRILCIYVQVHTVCGVYIVRCRHMKTLLIQYWRRVQDKETHRSPEVPSEQVLTNLTGHPSTP